jgi:hypothetical protein
MTKMRQRCWICRRMREPYYSMYFRGKKLGVPDWEKHYCRECVNNSLKETNQIIQMKVKKK